MPISNRFSPAPASLYTAALLLAAASFVTTNVHAEPSAADRESARSLMNEGDKKLAAHDAKGAMKAYQAAHEIMKVPSTGASYAQAALEAGAFVEARDACLQVARMPIGSSEPPAFQKARTQCAELIPRADTKIATVTIKWAPVPGVGDPTVTFDGVAVPSGALQVPRKVNPGKHVVEGALPGHANERSELEAKEGATLEISLAFKKVTPGAGPSAGSTASGTTTLGGDAPDAAARRSPLVYVGFGLAAAGFVTGGVTGGLALSKASDAKAGCVDHSCPRENEAKADSSRTFGTVSTIGFGVGIVGLGVGIYGLVASKRPPSSTAAAPLKTPRVAPFVGASTLGLQGEF